MRLFAFVASFAVCNRVAYEIVLVVYVIIDLCGFDSLLLLIWLVGMFCGWVWFD